MYKNSQFSGLTGCAALLTALLALGVAVPAATAQTRSMPSNRRATFGQLTEWAAGAWQLGAQVPRARLRLPEVPVLRLERLAAQEPAETLSAALASSISGYMDFHFNNIEHQDATLDFHRFVLLFTHRFSDRVRFVSELEVEHAFVAGLEEAGELELEQAYIDFLVTRALNFRAGMLLVPVGIINERHEPPVFHGVERPFVDTVIVPSTWFEAGAGVHGELGRGLRYRAYVMAPLDAAGFSADEGVRGAGRREPRRTSGTWLPPVGWSMSACTGCGQVPASGAGGQGSAFPGSRPRSRWGRWTPGTAWASSKRARSTPMSGWTGWAS